VASVPRHGAVPYAEITIEPYLPGGPCAPARGAADEGLLLRLGWRPARTAIVRSMLETERTLAGLHNSGCDVAQGFLLARRLTVTRSPDEDGQLEIHNRESSLSCRHAPLLDSSAGAGRSRAQAASCLP
jgi:hypothetical protein